MPSNATVVNAQLKMRYYAAVRPTGSTDPWVDRWVQAHQLLNNWNELQADSLKRLTGVNWLAPRGKIGPGNNPATEDANGQVESTVFFGQSETSTLPIWKRWNLTNLTQKWVKGTATNYGVILWATNEGVNGYDLRFYSSERADTTARPRLEVTWSQTPRTVYFLKDHLGSIRATVQDTSTAPVYGYDDYDPWGYILAGRSVNSVCGPTSMVTRNKFTGKEWDDEFGLNWYHFDWREYDPQIGRWMVRDPLAEKFPEWTPYHYVHNNPIRLVDPAGLDTTVYFFDQRQNPNDKRVYTAVVYIDSDGNIIGPFEGSTYPNDPNRHNTVKEGEYDFNNAHGHAGGSQQGLNIVQDQNETSDANRTGIPGVGPNGQDVQMSLVNVHSGVPPENDPAGLNRQNRGSAGCPTICPSDARSFFSNFDWSGRNGNTGNSTGTIVIYRGNSVGSVTTKTYLQVKLWFQKVF